MQEEDVVCQVLLALPKSYEAHITAVETIQPENLTLEYVKKRLLDEQVKRANSSSAGDAECSGESAFAGKKMGLKCFGCGKFGHKRSECPENRPTEESGPGRYRKNGGKFRKQKSGANVAEEMTFVATTTLARTSVAMMSEKTIDWILDSGATDHMVRNKDFVDELHPLDRKVRIAVAKSGEALIAEYAESVKVNMLVGKTKVPAVVKDVLYVPQLECNLFSVRRVEDNGMAVKFSNGTVTIMKDDRIVATGRRADQLYRTDIELRNVSDSASGGSCVAGAMASKKDVIDLWHRRFGHLGTASMKTLWKHGMVQTATKISDWPEQCICEVCLQGKQTRQPFDDVGERRASRQLEIIHSDVCGPFTPRTWDSKRFFVTFIDGFSHFTVVYLLESKDEVQSKFEEYCARVTAFFGTLVSRLTCDNGGEYTGKSFRKFCRTQGISVEATVPYSPQQNGVVERMNRTLLEKSRSMVHDAGLKKPMWGEAILTAAYVSKRSPTSALKEKKTPYEVWYGRKPNIDKMRVFGSVAYSWVPKEKRGKLDPKSEKNVMVGYTTNGYRVWDPRKRKISIARDVVFDEKLDGAGSTENRAEPVLYRDEEAEDPEDQPELIAIKPVMEQPSNPIDDQPEEAETDEREDCLTSEEDDADTALPSQLERVNCPAEVITRRSERERKLPDNAQDLFSNNPVPPKASAPGNGGSDDVLTSLGLNPDAPDNRNRPARPNQDPYYNPYPALPANPPQPAAPYHPPAPAPAPASPSGGNNYYGGGGGGGFGGASSGGNRRPGQFDGSGGNIVVPTQKPAAPSGGFFSGIFGGIQNAVSHAVKQQVGTYINQRLGIGPATGGAGGLLDATRFIDTKKFGGLFSENKPSTAIGGGSGTSGSGTISSATGPYPVTVDQRTSAYTANAQPNRGTSGETSYRRQSGGTGTPSPYGWKLD